MTQKKVCAPTTKWFCDECGGEILKPEDGWVEWQTWNKERRSSSGLRLVHHLTASPKKDDGDGCYYRRDALYKQTGASVSDMHMQKFLGPDGLMLLLSMSEDGMPARETAAMVMRLHLPGYEAARGHFGKAVADGVIEPNLPKGFYWQYEIAKVLDWVAKGSS
jgi:hypothetical protein